MQRCYLQLHEHRFDFDSNRITNFNRDVQVAAKQKFTKCVDDERGHLRREEDGGKGGREARWIKAIML